MTVAQLPSTRSGFALPLVVLVLAAMGIAGAAALSVGEAELQIARMHRDALRASLAAESAVRLAERSASEPAVSDSTRLPGGPFALLEGAWGDRVRFEAQGQWIDAELLVIRGRGFVSGSTRSATRIFWRLDPVARIRRRLAVLEVATSHAGDGRVLPPDGAESDRWIGPGFHPDRVFVGPPFPLDPALPNSGFPVLGGLDRATALRYADRVLSGGTFSPSPMEAGGVCVTGEPSNWGGAGDGGACDDFLPLVISDGSIAMSGGAGQGVLIVVGDLILEDAARFSGWVLVTGDLHVIEGSEILGFVRSGGASFVDESGRIFGSILESLRSLDRLAERLPPILPNFERSWLSGEHR